LVLGLHVAKKGANWIVRGVAIDTTNNAVLPTLIEHKSTASHDEATQAHDAHDAISSAITGLPIAAVVLLESDFSPHVRLTSGVRTRLRLEGAALSACKTSDRPVAVMNGPALGRAACNGGKKDAFDAASALGVSIELVEATAAALAARSLL
jgi:hypothetical protein